MTHRGGLSFSIIIWRIGGGGAKFSFALGPKDSLGGPDNNKLQTIKYLCYRWRFDEPMEGCFDWHGSSKKRIW
jgi:hypothetical protein